MTRAFFVLLFAWAITYAARSFVSSEATVAGSGAALAFGFLLVAALQFGRVFDSIRLPHLTGYILCGLLFGPEVLNLISDRMLDDLSLIQGTAVGLIAFLAGCELNLRELRSKLRDIVTLAVLTMAASSLLLFSLFYWMTFRLPVTAEFTEMERAAVALLCTNVLICFSPAVVIGIISETRSKGPLTQLGISVVVIADLIIVITFSLTSAFAHAVFPAAGKGVGFEALVPHIFGSIFIGALLGLCLALYVRTVGVRSGLFLFAMLFIVAEAGRAVHLNPLLVGLAAGLFTENLTPMGGAALVRESRGVVLPTFAIFFAVIGAEVHLRAFLHVAPFALAAAFVRAIGIYTGTMVSATVTGLERKLARNVPFSLLPQAGVALALAVLVLNDFQPWGQVLGTVLLGCIVVNEMVGPVLFRAALQRMGEIPPEETAENGEQAVESVGPLSVEAQ